MNDERNDSTEDVTEDMSDEELAVRAKELLGAAIAAAPAAPSVADIGSRIAARTGVAGAAPPPSDAPAQVGSAPAVGTAQRSAEAEADHDLAAYVTPASSSNGGARPGSRWPRLVLAAAAIVAVVALGMAMIGRGDSEQETIDQAQSPTTAQAPATGEAVAALPATPPAGQVLTWFGTSDTEEGEMMMLRYHGYSGMEPLSVTTAVVGPDYSIPEPDESGSIERWGDRDVMVTEAGRKAQFVDPSGVYVQVTGQPEDVAAFVPTLVAVDAVEWQAFVDEMSADIEAMPAVASYEVTTGGPEGLDIEGVDRIEVSVHADPRSKALGAVPEGGTGTASGVVAGTCLTVDSDTTCRPGDPMGDGVPRNVQTAQDVLIDGDWWQFGWATDELTSYTLEPDAGGEVEAFWYYEGTGQGDEMTWFAARIPDEAREVTVELGGSGGFSQRRPVR